MNARTDDRTLDELRDLRLSLRHRIARAERLQERDLVEGRTHSIRSWFEETIVYQAELIRDLASLCEALDGRAVTAQDAVARALVLSANSGGLVRQQDLDATLYGEKVSGGK